MLESGPDEDLMTTFTSIVGLCLSAPSAKDQEITWVVVVVLLVLVVHHLVHFLIKKNLSEKNSCKAGFKLGTSRSPVWHSSNWSYGDIVIKVFENYLLKDFKNHASDLGPVLVDTCSAKQLQPEPYFSLWVLNEIIGHVVTSSEKIRYQSKNYSYRVLIKMARTKHNWKLHCHNTLCHPINFADF